MIILNVLLSLLAMPLLVAALYLALLAAASLNARGLVITRPQLRFTFLIPAHNEAAGLQRTLDSLNRVNWPGTMFRVRVVADNCTDATAAVARGAGALVTERNDPDHPGKGQALKLGVAKCLEDSFTDAVVVIDADSTVDGNFLGAMQAHLLRGATVVQARYGVLNPGDGWRTRLMGVALALFHDVRSRGRQALGLSAGLRGNGMCFTRGGLSMVPLQADSLVEDVEQGIILGRAGVVVHHAMETRVLGEMPASRDAAASQRLRWELGRAQLRRIWLKQLWTEAWHNKSAVLADLAADLAMPTLSTVAVLIVLGWSTALILALAGGGLAALAMWSTALVLVVAYIARGVQLSGRGWRAWLDLGAAPLFVAWKLAVLLRNRTLPPTWVRTARVGERT